jgi:hypothetical protein
MPSNRFSGSVLSSISALTALTELYGPLCPACLLPQSAAECVWPACACACTFVHASLDARALSGRPIGGGCLIRSLADNPFAAATFPAFITALTRLERLYPRPFVPRSECWACDECVAQGLGKMQRHWPRALGNLHADRAHGSVRALPSST